MTRMKNAPDRAAASAIGLALLLALTAPAAGQWSAPVNLSNSPNFWSVDACFDFDANGKIHLLYRDWWNSDQNLLYTENLTGVWSAPSLVSKATHGLLRITPDNVIHVIYKRDSTIWEVTKPVGSGSWSPAVKINHDGSMCGSEICGDKWPAWAVVDSSGGLYVSYIYLWDDNSSGPKSALWGRYKPLGGAWGPVELIQGGPDRDHWPASSQLVANGTTIYATWELNPGSGTVPQYKARTGGVWGPSRNLDSKGGAARLAFSPTGQMAAAWSKDAGGSVWFEVYAKFSNDNGQTWFGEFNVSDNFTWLDRIPEITYDANGDLHVVYQRFDCDGCQPDMWYRKYNRLSGTWDPKINLTNNPSRTAAGFQAIRNFGNTLHFIYTDNPGNGIEDLFYRTTSVTPPPNVGSLQGVVTNSFGAALSGVSVVTSPGNFGALSAANGAYSLINVPVGSYSVTASKPYHNPVTVHNVAIQNGQTQTLNFTLTGQPPAAVVNLTVSPTNTANFLTWANPGSGNFSGTVVRFKTDGYPVDANDGTLLVDRAGAPFSVENFSHTGLTNGTTYYYSAFAYFSDAGRYYATATHASATPFGPGDFDHDGDVDQADFGFFQRCLTGATVPVTDPACLPAKFDGDNDIDRDDFLRFRNCISGPGQPADPNCAS